MCVLVYACVLVCNLSAMDGLHVRAHKGDTDLSIGCLHTRRRATPASSVCACTQE
jgi:hypothetical protein